MTSGTSLLDQLKKIKAFVFDIDGVLTDGTVLLLENGLQARRMNVKDGLALQMALQKKYPVIIISGGASQPVIDRLRYLGITEIHLGLKDKLKHLTSIINQMNLEWSGVLYMGDDLPDLSVLREVGLACCPADAVSEVIQICTYISPKRGGEGCVRDVIEKVLKINNDWLTDSALRSI